MPAEPKLFQVELLRVALLLYDVTPLVLRVPPDTIAFCQSNALRMVMPLVALSVPPERTTAGPAAAKVCAAPNEFVPLSSRVPVPIKLIPLLKVRVAGD